MNEREYSKYFKAFGDKSRLKILELLASKEMTVNEIVAAVGLSQPTISRHLGVLREADVVVDRRDGQNVYYSLNRKSVQSCCEGFCCCLKIRAGSEKKKNRKK